MLEKPKREIAVQLDQYGNPIPRRKEQEKKVFILLVDTLEIDQNTGDNIRTWEKIIEEDINTARQVACDTIINMLNCMQIDILASKVISGKSKLENAISFYTFLRYCIDPRYHGNNTVQFGNDGDGNYMTIEDLNSFIINEFDDVLYDWGIYDENDLNRFYECDFNYREYIPRDFDEE